MPGVAIQVKDKSKGSCYLSLNARLCEICPAQSGHAYPSVYNPNAT